MTTDSLEAIRPKLVLLKNIEDAATAVDEMFASTVQGSGREYSFPIYPRDSDSLPVGAGEGSGDDSGDEGERPTNDDDEEEEDEDDNGTINSLVGPSHSTETPFSSLSAVRRAWTVSRTSVCRHVVPRSPWPRRGGGRGICERARQTRDRYFSGIAQGRPAHRANIVGVCCTSTRNA